MSRLAHRAVAALAAVLLLVSTRSVDGQLGGMDGWDQGAEGYFCGHDWTE